MDSYLEIAKEILRLKKQPMTPKEIIREAFKKNIVSTHLHGNTQHKTLQARLSEDILHKRNNSEFFRTRPGQFFLTEFLSDPNICGEFKNPFPARRRTRDLNTGPILSLNAEYVKNNIKKEKFSWQKFISTAEKNGAISYNEKNNETSPEKNVEVWTFTIVKKNNKLFSYRVGRYRDDRDTFLNKISIGLPGAVSLDDYCLFSQNDYGVSDNAYSAIVSDLDLPLHALTKSQAADKPEPTRLLFVENKSQKHILLVVMEWACPDWYEPTTKRLSLNNPQWKDVNTYPNNIDDFEPWSVAAIEEIFRNRKNDFEKDPNKR